MIAPLPCPTCGLLYTADCELCRVPAPQRPTTDTKRVPREPTREMRQAGEREYMGLQDEAITLTYASCATEVWRAMYDAAPKINEGGQDAVRATGCAGEHTPTPVPPSPDCGHGHVYPRADGIRARCGGPGICPMCSIDQARKINEDGQDATTCNESGNRESDGIDQPVPPSPDDLLAADFKINCGGTHWKDCWQEHVTCYAQELRRALLETRARAEAAERECVEQARLNGMGSQREAALLTRAEAAERELAMERERTDALFNYAYNMGRMLDAARKP